MSEQSESKQQLWGYLLGALPEAEAERFEELSVVDGSFAARLDEAENELVDAYAAGSLSGEESKRFQAHYLASPRRREKVRFAEAFLSYATAAPEHLAPDRAPAPKTSGRYRRTPRWLGFGAGHSSTLQWGLLAACVAIVVLAAYSAYRASHLQQRIDQVQAERLTLLEREKDLEHQLDDARTANDEAARQLESVRERLLQLEQVAANIKQEKNRREGGNAAAPVPSPAESVIALALAAPVRGTGQPPAVQLPASARVLAITLGLDPGNFDTYDALLKDAASGHIVWRKNGLKPVAKQSGNVVVTRIPAALLKSQTYTLDLTGVSADGTSEMFGSYVFRVAKP